MASGVLLSTVVADFSWCREDVVDTGEVRVDSVFVRVIRESGFRAKEEVDCEGTVESVPFHNVVDVPLTVEVRINSVVRWKRIAITS